MFSTAVAQSSPAFFTFLHSTRKDWMGKPRFPRGIQVTYADVSVAAETVGLSGASGAAARRGRGEQCETGADEKHTAMGYQQKNKKERKGLVQHLQRAHPSEVEEKRVVSKKMVRTGIKMTC